MVERTLIWSDPAKADLAAIFEFYYHRNGNSNYNHQLWSEFREKLGYVVDNPYLGERWKKSVFRFVVAKPFQLFYRVTKTEIIVAAVWDSRRNPKTLKLTR